MNMFGSSQNNGLFGNNFRGMGMNNGSSFGANNNAGSGLFGAPNNPGGGIPSVPNNPGYGMLGNNWNNSPAQMSPSIFGGNNTNQNGLNSFAKPMDPTPPPFNNYSKN